MAFACVFVSENDIYQTVPARNSEYSTDRNVFRVQLRVEGGKIQPAATLWFSDGAELQSLDFNFSP